MQTPETSDFIVGVDVGQLHDFSSVMVLERRIPAVGPQTYQLRHIDRFRQIHAEARANSPAWVADHLAAILLGSLTPDEVLYRIPDEHP